MEALKIKGTVFSGKGEGARFIELPEVKEQIEDKLDFVPYPGTLNLRLPKKELPKRASLKEAKGKKILTSPGFHTGVIFEVRLKNGLKCGVVIPQTPDYPKDMLEVVAPTRLRERLKLEDGDLVEITILIG